MAKKKEPEHGIVGGDQYMRYTDKKGTTWVDHHRVIAGGKFAENQAAEFVKNGGKAEAITKEAYDAARKKAKH